MQWLEIVSKNHEEWVSIVRSFGAGVYSDDIVQDTYLRLHKYNASDKVVKDGKVQKSYMWVCLKSVFYDHTKEEAKRNQVHLDSVSELQTEQTDRKRKEAIGRFDQLVEEEMNKWHWYDRTLFQYYKNTDMSMRDLERDTGISLTSIYQTIKNCKTRLKENVSEHYEDLINEDYERL